jgi:ornithine--oxo-acid transaminase
MPISGVLGSDEVMLQVRPGEHGSTYGGNPLAARTVMASLDVII